MLALASFAALAFADAPAIHGRVIDPAGAPVEGARIVVSGTAGAIVSDADGGFQLELPGDSSVALTIEARGFLSRRHLVRNPSEGQVIILEPARYADQITVTATRTASRVAESPGSVVILDRSELASAAAPTLDDALRQVPGFTLFRRSGSRTSNPTTQGASLRGIGASGASRALVLDDGIPLNDPFGGWVAWGRVPQAAVERVEVLRGGASELYGSGALSGVVQMIRRSDRQAFDFTASYGSQQTALASFFGASPMGNWTVATSAELFRTDGYVPVREQERGFADTQANSRRAAAEITLSRSGKERFHFFTRASLFDEARGNGTLLQTNDTFLRQLSAGATWSLPSGISADLRGFLMDQMYHQSFSTISADRSSERLNRLQEVPVHAYGVAGQAVHSAGKHVLVSGFEARSVEGFTNEQAFAATVTRSEAGGTQTIGGAFIEDLFQPTPRLTITATARLDAWENRDARLVSGSVISRFADRRETSFSPRVAMLYRLGDRFALTGSAYRAFRAPTLNELYRSFRVGNVLTLANEKLRAERLDGLEAGLIFTAPRAAGRLTLFEMSVERNVANVTLTVEPNLITRQRQNLGETRSRGIELDLQGHIGAVRITTGYLLVDAVVRDFPANRTLEGLQVAQVPRHQAAVQLSLPSSRWGALAVQTRWVADQFEDDQNQLPLRGYFVADLFAARQILSTMQAFLAAENLFDRRFEVGRTPVTTVGPPRSIRAGFRWQRPTTFP